MRAGLITSASLHAALLLAGFVSLPGARPFETEPVDALPVELVTVAEITRLREGDQEAPDREVQAPRQITPEPEEPEPEQPEEPVGEADTPQETPPTEDPDQVAALPQPQAQPEPTVEPEPAPEEAPQQEAEPEPAPVEPEPQPQAEEAPKTQPITARPKVKPKPPRPTATANRDRASEQTALLNKVDPSGGGTQRSSEPASLGTRRGNDNALLTQNELDGLRDKISSCWNVPPGAEEGQDLKVQIKFTLNRQGVVDSSPQVMNSSSHPQFPAAAAAARRAIQRCGPYTNLPPDKFDAWKDVELTFDPREMFGVN